MQSPLLTTPNQYEYDNPVVELDDRIIKKWLSDLPLLNLSQTIDELFNAIKPLNEQNVTDKQRLKLLELYRQPTIKVIHSFELNTIRLLPLTQEQKEHLTDDITYLSLEMANGYKILVKRGFLQKKDLSKDSSYLLCIYRAMEMISEAIVHCYQVYREPPAFAYLELHQLFQYAERNRASNITCKVVGKSITDLYTQLLLFAIADPYHLAEGDARAVYEFLGNYTQICLLNKQPTVAEEDIGLFTIDLAGDNPPMPVARNRIYRRSPDFRLLDARPVLATLLKQVKKNDDKNKSMTEKEKILGRLVPNLTAVQLRKEPRRKKSRKVNVAMGLQAIHHYLTDMADDGIMHGDLDKESLSILQDQQQFSKLIPWVVANESKRGYLLFQPCELGITMAIGDIIGIESTDTILGNVELVVATIRWMRLNQDNQNQIGVEIICRNGHPCKIYDENEPANRINSILFLTGGCHQMILPQVNLPERLILETDTNRRYIKLQQRLGETTYYRLQIVKPV